MNVNEILVNLRHHMGEMSREDTETVLRACADIICESDGREMFDKHKENIYNLICDELGIEKYQLLNKEISKQVLELFYKISYTHLKTAAAFHVNEQFNRCITDFNDCTILDDMIVPYMGKGKILKYFINDHKNI